MQHRQRSLLLISGLSVCWFTSVFRAYGDTLPKSSIGLDGIEATKLHQAPYNLKGRKIAIGQVEIGRPGQFGLDKAVAKNRSTSVAQVFFRNSPPRQNANVDIHAQNVASVMINSDKAFVGVAPGARLYSSAVGLLKRNGQPEECLSAQHIASQNGGDVRAINFSFGESLEEDPRPGAMLDGNALLTQCIDWSSRVHDTLYVVAGNQGRGGISIPTDNFNGMNIAFSSRLKGIFAKVDLANLGDAASGMASRILGLENNVGDRRAISLIAPGSNVPIVNPDGKLTRGSGTSFAAPHVTATVALIQEYGDRQLSQRRPNWTTDSRRHEVMKAVLMNAADKLQDTGDGLRLGMSRTIVDKSNQNWLGSDAYKNQKIPLHIQMGTGQLNAFRAYQQFSPGEWNSSAPVPPIGWDYHTIGVNAAQDYVLEKPLPAGSYVSATLAWDRRVELKDTNRNELYDLGEEFSDRGLNNLDLYLMRDEDNDVSNSIWSSVSDVDSVEHLFYPVPTTGRYKIRVVYRRQVNDAAQPYALAWWTKPIR